MNKNLSYTRSKCYENSIQTISMEVASNQHRIPGNVNLVYIAVLSSHSVCNETSTLYKFSLLSVRFVVALLGNLAVFIFSDQLLYSHHFHGGVWTYCGPTFWNSLR